jgi:hypothetical protein
VSVAKWDKQPLYISLTEKAFNLTLETSKVSILIMNSLENSLNKIAENILHIDEASLISLWDKYKNKVEQFSISPEWQKAVIIFSIINAVRAKNAIFNEKLLNNKTQKKTVTPEKPQSKPYLKLVK